MKTKLVAYWKNLITKTQRMSLPEKVDEFTLLKPKHLSKYEMKYHKIRSLSEYGNGIQCKEVKICRMENKYTGFKKTG